MVWRGVLALKNSNENHRSLLFFMVWNCGGYLKKINQSFSSMVPCFPAGSSMGKPPALTIADADNIFDRNALPKQEELLSLLFGENKNEVYEN